MFNRINLDDVWLFHERSSSMLCYENGPLFFLITLQCRDGDKSDQGLLSEVRDRRREGREGVNDSGLLCYLI